MSIIDILTTGGTIDKIYFDQKSAYEVGDPIIGPLLTSMNVGFDFTVEQLMRVDSLDMTDADRFIIYERTKRSSSQQVLITHGTDGMIKTAQKLSKIKGKTIVLTGSLQPAAFAHNDAVFKGQATIGRRNVKGSKQRAHDDFLRANWLRGDCARGLNGNELCTMPLALGR